jgi:hypothetical protein
MLAAIRLAGVIGLCAGGLVAAVAFFVPNYRTVLNELGAGLILVGVALFGLAAPFL